MPTSKPVRLLSGPEDDEPSEASMRFRLTYDGPLRATQRDPIANQRNPLAAHKHDIRKVFHGQLKQLWQTDKFLSTHMLSRKAVGASRPIGDEKSYYGSPTDEAPMAEVVADLYRQSGYRFVPLVREEWSLLCSLSILFLRRDYPGSVLQAGDIDNRVKTVIDALRKPKDAQELAGHEAPGPDEDPFFVLMEDDKMVSHLDVETDVLLAPPGGDLCTSRARLIVTVELRPYYATMFNLSFS